MRIPLRIAAATVALSATLWAQQFQFKLDHLAPKAADSVEVSLNTSMLQFAAKFLSGKDPDEAKVKRLIVGVQGIYVRHFEFKQDGAYSQADLDRIRQQLRSPEWGRIVGVQSNSATQRTEVWVRMENGKVSGVAILSSEPRELTVANIVGKVDLEDLADLGGHFGLPKMQKK
jgi:hypothetical protein